MAYELFYTSAPKGLRPHTSGICTVGMTKGFPAPFIPRLEALSGYRPPFKGAPLADCPIAYSHWIIEAGGVMRHILASVRATNPDHTLRSNKLAYYLLLREGELSKIGPAWLLSQPGVMSSEWFGEPREFESEKILPEKNTMDCVRCDAWEQLTGDAGWAGVIVNSAMLDSTAPCSVVYPKGTDVLQLIHEALLLIPPELRWRVTFSTYFMEPFAGLRCAWRFCMDGTPAASAARQSPGLTIDLCIRGKCNRNGQFIEAARVGKEVVLRRDQVSSSESDSPTSLWHKFVSDESSTVFDGKNEQRAHSVSNPARQVDFGFRANRERQLKIAIFGSGFLFAAIIAMIFIIFSPLRAISRLESPLVTEESGIVKSQDLPNVIVPPLDVATSDENINRAVDAERKRWQQMTIDANREIAEAIAENKILQAKIQGIEKELATAKALSAAIIPTPAIPGIPTRAAVSPTAAIDLLSSMPTKANAWKLFKLPTATRDKFGSIEGTAEFTVGAKIERIVWFPHRTLDPKAKKFFEISQSDDQIFLHSNGHREKVASVGIDDMKVSFSWVTSAATSQSNPTLVKDFKDDLRSTALIVCMDRVFEWYIFDAIPKIRLEPNSKRRISYTNTSTGLHYSVDGEKWVPFKVGVVYIDIPTDNGLIGKLECRFVETENFFSVEFEYPKQFDKLTLERAEEATKKAKEIHESAKEELEQYDRIFSRPSEPEMIKLRKEAVVAAETARGKVEDAEKEEKDIKDSQNEFLDQIQNTCVLIGPENGVPIAEIQIKSTRSH